MTLDERLNYCRVCENRKMNPAIGLVCGLTNAKPVFDPTCPDIKIDEQEADRLISLERTVAEEEFAESFDVNETAMNMGVWGGALMIVIAIAWLLSGVAEKYSFYYGPLLVLGGIIAILRGIYK